MMAVPLNGCLFLLLRLFVGRGLAGTLVRAGRVGRVTSALTFGRGVAVGMRLAPIASARLPTIQILGPGRQMLARSQSSATASTIYMGRAAVFESRRASFGFRHFDFDGPVGRSMIRQGGDLIEHQSEAGEVLALDRIRPGGRAIEHFTPEGARLGETRFEQNGEDVNVRADDEVLASLTEMHNDLGLNCPDAREAYERWQQAQNACSRGSSNDCRTVSSWSSRYQYLRSQCVAGD